MEVGKEEISHDKERKMGEKKCLNEVIVTPKKKNYLTRSYERRDDPILN